MALEDKIGQYQKLNLMGPQTTPVTQKGFNEETNNDLYKKVYNGLLTNPDNSNNP